VANPHLRSLDGLGTDETVWMASEALRSAPAFPIALPPSGRVVVVAPHPDDEVLGAGGTTALFLTVRAQILLIAVTDGEASAPERAEQLRRIRPLESACAAAALGVTPHASYALRLPDGGVSADTVELALRPLLEPGDLVLAPWVRDGHPDHEATGLGAQRACHATDATLMAYLVWAWHWAQPSELPGEALRRVDLDEVTVRRKRRAVQCFTSQLAGPDPILNDLTVQRLTRDFEVFVSP
jgi:LmbE family N-acetylglucosaminyl deacetylase